MKALFLGLLGFLALTTNSFAQEEADGGEKGGNLPRMVSIRSELVNARSGPGSRYPIEWVYKQKGAPVEIVAEYELWRKIKDWEGSESWVHKAMLSSQRTVKIISKGENNLYAKPDYKSKIIAKIEDQVVGSVAKCPYNVDFCQIRFERFEGWLPRSALFGVYDKEVIN